MRYLWAIIGSIAVIALAAVSAMANWTFGLSLGTDEPITALFGYVTTTSMQFFGNASLAADVLKCTMIFGVTIGLRSRAMAGWVAGIVCLVIWAVCLGWSIQSAIGFVALNHQKVVDGAGKTADAWGDAAEKMTRLRDQRNLVPVHREQSIVQADIEAKRSERLFNATDNCRDFRGKAQTSFCQHYRGLLAEEASATSAIALDTQIEKLRIERDGRKKVSVADPLAVSLARLTSTSTGDVSTYRSWIFAFIVEFISAFGLWAIWTSLGNTRCRETKPFDFDTLRRKAEATVDRPEATTVASPAPATVAKAELPEAKPTPPERLPEPKKTAALQASAGTTNRVLPFRSAGANPRLASLDDVVAFVMSSKPTGRHYFADLQKEVEHVCEANFLPKPHEPIVGGLIAAHCGSKGRRDGSRGNATFYTVKRPKKQRSNQRAPGLKYPHAAGGLLEIA